MQIKETPDVSFPGVVESPPLEDVVVLADSAGVALGVQRAFSARVRSVRDDGSGLIASRCVEIPLVGRDGEISGVLCRTAPRSDTRGVFVLPRAGGGEGDRGRGAVRGPRHQQPSRCDRQRPAAARVPERRRIPKGHRRQNAARDHARSVAQPSAPRRCATAPQVDRRVRRRQSPRSDGGHAGPGVASGHHGPHRDRP